MLKYELSEWNFKSKYWDQDALHIFEGKYKCNDIPNCPCTRVIASEENYNRLLAIASQHISNKEKPFYDKFVAKWNTPQGGTTSFETAEPLLLKYSVDETPQLDFGGMRLIRETMVSHFEMDPIKVYYKTIIIRDEIEVFHIFNGDHKSYGGVIYNGDRRDIECLQLCYRIYHMGTDTLDPLMVFVRYKDGKRRCIFCDPQSNIFKEYKYLYRIFEWWTQHPSNHKYSDLYLSYLIASLGGKSYYCGDYKSMDTHFYEDEAHLAVDIACDALSACWEDRQAVHGFIETLFQETEVILGKYIYVGLHSLLSGMYPTHDIEGILNYSILCTVCKELSIKVIHTPRKLRKGEAFILVCGDDSIVLFGSKYDEEQLKLFASTHIKVAGWCGQVVEPDKVEYGYDDAIFCKKMFALSCNSSGYKKICIGGKQVPLWKASIHKCIHALWQPESLPGSDWTPEAYVLWMCSIMDGARGCDQYKAVVDALFDQLPFSPSSMSFDNEALQRAFKILNKDWWMRNFGDKDIQSSPTFIEFKLRFGV